jgi:ribonucleoside-diphosphate reductase alpha chain
MVIGGLLIVHIPLTNNATMSDILNVVNMAYDLGCKGVTVFRYGSRSQVLHMGNEETMPGCQCCG